MVDKLDEQLVRQNESGDMEEISFVIDKTNLKGEIG